MAFVVVMIASRVELAENRDPVVDQRIAGNSAG